MGQLGRLRPNTSAYKDRQQTLAIIYMVIAKPYLRLCMTLYAYPKYLTISEMVQSWQTSVPYASRT